MTRLTELWRDEDGQDMVEYSLLMAFIALCVVSLLSAVNGNIFRMWSSMNTTVSNAVVMMP